MNIDCALYSKNGNKRRLIMNRQVFLNDAPNVTLYASEGGENTNCLNVYCGKEDDKSDQIISTIATIIITVATSALTAAFGGN